MTEGTDGTLITRTPFRLRMDRGLIVACLTVFAAASVGLLLWDDWFVNWDGGFYLALARSLRFGQGYEFPDGSPAVFRGPLYPALLAGSWSVLPATAKTAMWVSRGVLVANAMIVTYLVVRGTTNLLSGVIAGLAAGVQPLPLISGGLFFVPDALAAFFVLTSIAILASGPTTSSSIKRLLLTGVLIGMGFLTKETTALALLIPAGLLLHQEGRAGLRGVAVVLIGWLLSVLPWWAYSLVIAGTVGPIGWVRAPVITLVLGLVLAGTLWLRVFYREVAGAPISRMGAVLVGITTFLVPLAVLNLLAGTPIRGVLELGSAVLDDLDTQLYRASPWLGLAPAAVLALVWGMWQWASHLSFLGLLFTGLGLAGLLNAVQMGAGLRNGLLIAYGLAILIGVLVAGAVKQTNVAVKVVTLVSALAFLTSSWLASSAVNERVDDRGLTWHAPATLTAAEWLKEVGEGRAMTGTPMFLTSLWLLADGEHEVSLIPIFVGHPSADPWMFNRRIWWAGTVPDAPSPENKILALTLGRTAIGGIFGRALEDHINDGNAELLVVTGNLADVSVFDGGILLPHLERSSAMRRVYASSIDHLPQWVVVYEVVGEFVADPVEVVVHRLVDTPLPAIGAQGGIVREPDYRSMVIEVLLGPLGEGSTFSCTLRDS